MADETELFYTPVSKVVVFATLLVSVSDLHKGLSSFVFPVKQITQNPPLATAYRFESGHRHHKKQDTPRVPCFFRIGRWGKFRNSSQTALAFFVAICYHRDHKLKAPP